MPSYTVRRPPAAPPFGGSLRPPAQLRPLLAAADDSMSYHSSYATVVDSFDEGSGRFVRTTTTVETIDDPERRAGDDRRSSFSPTPSWRRRPVPSLQGRAAQSALTEALDGSPLRLAPEPRTSSAERGVALLAPRPRSVRSSVPSSSSRSSARSAGGLGPSPLSRSSTPQPLDETTLEAERWANRALESRIAGDTHRAREATGRALALAGALPEPTYAEVVDRVERPRPWVWARAAARRELAVDDALLAAEAALRVGDRTHAQESIAHAETVASDLPRRQQADVMERIDTARSRASRVRPVPSALRTQLAEYLERAEAGGPWSDHYVDLARSYAERLPSAAERRAALDDVEARFPAAPATAWHEGASWF